MIVSPVPARPGATPTNEEQRREITELQQRTRALEAEIQRRQDLENALREALGREKEARAEAERSARFNDMFAGMLGHDLRNPLSAISTGALYIVRLNASPKSAKAATRILSSAERMARMIDQLLDFTRICVGGGLALAPARVDLQDLAAKIKDELEAANPDRAIVVELRGDVTGEWDRDRVQQVFSNLVGNALHHGRADEPVTIGCDGTDDASVALSIHNGGEVPPQLAEILFEPFRGASRSQRTRGLGLGLFITQQIVHAHGGSIRVVSDAAGGTTFHLTLPRAIPARPQPITPEPP